MIPFADASTSEVTAFASIIVSLAGVFAGLLVLMAKILYRWHVAEMRRSDANHREEIERFGPLVERIERLERKAGINSA